MEKLKFSHKITFSGTTAKVLDLVGVQRDFTEVIGQ